MVSQLLVTILLTLVAFKQFKAHSTQFDARNYSREMLAVRLLDATLMEALKVI